LHPCPDTDFKFCTGADMIPTIHQKDKLLYEQIYEFYKEAILNRRLAHRHKLPSHRTLAKELGVGINTVLKAYEQLAIEGYVTNEHRKGLFVTMIDNKDWKIHDITKRTATKKTAAKTIKADFKTSMQLVDENHFPVKEWRKCSNWALDKVSFQYQEYEGIDPLKQPLMDYLLNYRGVHSTAERLLIGSGTSVMIFWLAFILRKSCSKIIVEEPCYPRSRAPFLEFGYDVKPVAVDHEGIDLRTLNKEKADLLYLTPSHQYPTGAAIPVTHRLQILNWAKKNKAYIIEDDFDCEFRYKTKLMPSLQGLDKSDRVIYAGTFSSALMPSLRVAYLVLPENFPVDYRAYRYLTTTVPYFTRKTLAWFMEDGYWERHLKKMRIIYKKKYETCIEALRKLPAGRIHFNNTPSGLNILLRINTRLSEREIINRARDKGILVTAAGEFYLNHENRPKQPQVLFEFGSIPQDQIEKVVATLAAAWFRS
jgi:GntR family transcriptional regulator/MocR family aminotransferase